MSLPIETNKWTPKLIVVFQLTIWSIVGIVLLQKGAISLRERMKTRNDTADIQEKFTRWNRRESIRESTNGSESRHQITKIQQAGVQQTNRFVDNVDDLTSNERFPRKLHALYRTDNIDRENLKKTSMFDKRITSVYHERDARGTRAIQTLTVHANNKDQVKNINHEENVIVSLASNEHPSDTEKATTNNTNLTRSNQRNSFEHQLDGNTTVSYGIIENGKNETKPRRSPVNKIGAAIAIIMLAIGIIMLLLGPFIVVLRALSNRRRTREMLNKKRNHSDQPPTYEEATLMDQVPRYSTLQLDTIVESSFSL